MSDQSFYGGKTFTEMLQNEVKYLKAENAKLTEELSFARIANKALTKSNKLDFTKPIYDPKHNEMVVIHRVGKSSVEYGYKLGELRYIISLEVANNNWSNICPT